MDLTSLSREQLRESLASLQRSTSEHPFETTNQLQQMVQELEMHRIQLEMQNRALQDMRGELEYAMRRYTDLYDHLPIGYVTLAPSGEILEANLTAASWLGVDRPQLCGMSLSRFLSPFDAGRFAAHLEACVETRAERVFETMLRLDSGAMIPVQLSSRVAPPSREGGTRILSAVTNVSQLKQSQHQLNDLRRDQDAFGNSISHDLRSPLVTIGTYARIVLSDYADTLQPEVKGMLERVERAAQRMEATLQQMLTYNVLLREEVSFETVRTDELVQGVLGEHRTQIEATKAEVKVVRPMPPVLACPRLLAPAVSNLISNALKFTRPGEPPRVTISTEEQGLFVVLKIADQGIGIDAQHHERIFGMFDRLHCYSDYPGTGVGLAIVKRAIERMRGQVWVESEKDVGSCFQIMLPRADA